QRHAPHLARSPCPFGRGGDGGDAAADRHAEVAAGAALRRLAAGCRVATNLPEVRLCETTKRPKFSPRLQSSKKNARRTRRPAGKLWSKSSSRPCRRNEQFKTYSRDSHWATGLLRT